MTDSPDATAEPAGRSEAAAADAFPPGDHPVELAARRGFGPLSPAAGEAWHGGGRPCVTCGQLVRRDATACEHCGQDLSPEMVERMRAHAGPWYVLEHVRPFPGVSLDRIIRQVHRGRITTTSIVRGPSTDYQWRFAVETPGLCRFFRRCWHCFGEVSPSDSICRACGASLTFDQAAAPPSDQAADRLGAPAAEVGRSREPREPSPVRLVAGDPASAMPFAGAPRSSGTASAVHSSARLEMLGAAAQQVGVAHRDISEDGTLRVGGIRVAWIAVVIVAAVFAGLIWITRARSSRTERPSERPPAVVLPSRTLPIENPSDP